MVESFALVATDLDGTLVCAGQRALSDRSARVLQALDRLGVAVVLVTARPPRSVRPFRAMLGRHGLAICANGALVYDVAADRVVSEYTLQPELALRIVETVRCELPDIAFAVEAGMEFAHEPHYVPGMPVPEDVIVAEVEQLIARPIAKLLARHPHCETDELIAIAQRALGGIAPVHNSGAPRLLEFSAPGVSKAMALERLADDLGVTQEAVLAFGDMPNDIPMLTWAGHGVAVANAHPDVLAVADATTEACEEEGVAAYLERCFRAQLARAE